jgi:transcriptional regulator of acetoin/glycerol metabolism
VGATVSVDEADLDFVTEGVPSLVRVMACDRPLSESARISLDGVTAVSFGRGDTHATTLDGGRLAIAIPDDRMSGSHARLSRVDRRFVLEDCESKNGTAVNGKRVDVPVELADGDVIETGHTFFVYRARVPRGLAAEPSGTGEGFGADDLPLATFVPMLARQYERLAKIAPSNIPVVVTGETGTGKEVVARALHRQSGRAGAFLALNCGAIPGTLVESELFGARKGAFSGAVEDRPGLVRAADGGTLFLDEIGELPLAAQVALLRVLQEQEVLPIGGTKPIKVDVRIVAATHKALDRMVDSGSFRADLYARLGGLVVRLPALRDRREDLGLIVTRLLRRIAPDAGDVRISRAAARAIFQYSFPHNIRELEKALALGLAIARGEQKTEIDLEGFPDELRAQLRPLTAQPRNEDVAGDDDAERKAHLIALLTRYRGRVADVARAMGKARMQIHRWIQRYDIDLEAYRKL